MITMQIIDELVNMSRIPLENYWLDKYVAHNYSVITTRLNYYRFLYWLVAEMHPKIAVELGVETGTASAHMAVAAMMYGGHVIGIDLNDAAGFVQNIYAYTGCYTYISGDTVSSVYRVKEIIGNKKIGIVFQDSSHHYQESVNEWNAYSKLLDSPAVWVCDDILPVFHDPKIDPPGMSMVEYWNTLPGAKKLYSNVLNHGNTMGIAIL